MRTWLEETLAKHTGRPIEQVRKDIERDKILTAEQAKEYGLIDEVLASRKARSTGSGTARRVTGRPGRAAVSALAARDAAPTPVTCGRRGPVPRPTGGTGAAVQR